MSSALLGYWMDPTGSPFAHTSNVTSFKSADVFAAYLPAGVLLIAWSGGAVEFACDSVVFDGSGV